MSKQQIRLEFISAGFKAILTSPGVKDLVTQTGARIQSEANAGVEGESEGFSSNTWLGAYGGGRWVNSVTSSDRIAAEAEAEDKVLSKAVHP